MLREILRQRQGRRLLIVATLIPILTATPVVAVSADSATDSTSTVSQNRSLKQLEQRIRTLEKKLVKREKSFRVNGFISAALSSSDNEAITESWGGITKKNDFAALSNIGIQLSFSPNPHSEIIAQLVSRGEEEWDMEAEWAYISLRPTAGLTLRFGRQKAPLYLLSEYIEVGFANPWVYAPDEVYGITGDSTYDGISMLYTVPTLNWDTTLQVMWGNNTFVTAIAGETSLEDMVSMSITTRSETITGRLGYTSVKTNINDLSIPLPSIPSFGISAGDTLNFSGGAIDITYAVAGFIYDNSHLVVMSEYSQLEVEGWFGDVTGVYLMTGYQFGKLMPHFTISNMENQDPGARDVGVIISASTGNALPLPGAVGGSIADAFMVQNQTTYTLGIRYELLPSVSLKAELSHITDFDGSGGQFIASAPPTEDEVNILKFSIDSVF